MAEHNSMRENESRPYKSGRCHAACGGVYGLGFIGALVYFVQHATSFWIGVLGVGKAIVWPAILVYRALDLLKM
jgi:hypothetical protein